MRLKDNKLEAAYTTTDTVDDTLKMTDLFELLKPKTYEVRMWLGYEKMIRSYFLLLGFITIKN